MEKRKVMSMCGREGGGGVGVQGVLVGDVGVRVACSLRNFYGMWKSNFHQFYVRGFKRGIGNFVTKRRFMHSTITGG